MKKFTGNYIGEEGLPFRIDLADGKLGFQIYSQKGELVKDTGNRFLISGNPDISFAFSINKKDTLLDIKTPDDDFHLFKYKETGKLTDEELSQYTGTYYSAELDCKYSIVLKDHGLILSNVKYPDAKLTVVNNDHLTSDNWWINHLKMVRDSSNKVTGFEINSGRIMHLKFVKLNEQQK